MSNEETTSGPAPAVDPYGGNFVGVVCREFDIDGADRRRRLVESLGEAAALYQTGKTGDSDDSGSDSLAAWVTRIADFWVDDLDRPLRVDSPEDEDPTPAYRFFLTLLDPLDASAGPHLLDALRAERRVRYSRS